MKCNICGGNETGTRVAGWRLPGYGPGYGPRDIITCCPKCIEDRVIVRGEVVIEGETVPTVILRQPQNNRGPYVKGESGVTNERPFTPSRPRQESCRVKIKVKNLREFRDVPKDVEINTRKDGDGNIWLEARWTQDVREIS